jgi:hypothetical protein
LAALDGVDVVITTYPVLEYEYRSQFDKCKVMGGQAVVVKGWWVRWVRWRWRFASKTRRRRRRGIWIEEY